MLAVEAGEEFDPEDGDGLVVAAGCGVLAADGCVVAPDAESHMVCRSGLSERVHVSCSAEQMRGVGEVCLGQSSGFERGDKRIDFGFGFGESDGHRFSA